MKYCNNFRSEIIPISISISVLDGVFPFSLYSRSQNNSYFSFLFSLTETDNFTSNSYFR